MLSRQCPHRGFVLKELIIVLVTLSLVFLILAPVFMQQRAKMRNHSCLLNVKRIGAAMRMYAQDYDETFPPTYAEEKTERGTVLRNWGGDYTPSGAATAVNGLIDPYINEPSTFRCPMVSPSSPRKAVPLTYMYNDLAAAVKMKEFANPESTVLIAESEPWVFNFGHSNSAVWSGRPSEDRFLPNGQVSGIGAIRHYGRAHYGFADGHTRSLRLDSVYFPPGSNHSRSHKNIAPWQGNAPDPAGNMKLGDRLYHATFHLK
jgi:prepilin-type processing-associated H-X9-DG protein